MGKKHKLLIFILLAAVSLEVIALLFFLLQQNTFALLDPKGFISTQQRNLIVFAISLAAVVVIPVFLLIFSIIWRNDKKSNQTSEDAEASPKLQLLWWAIPSVIILILAPVMWLSTHNLDPRKAMASSNKPLTIEVVALQWKWLFIYPEQDIATVNFVQFPVDTPVNFKLTADAPMNSFWIPQLGGQMYAMAGMNTKMNLMATQVGEYRGQSAEISGAGFAGMKFTAKATSEAAFESWVNSVKMTPGSLTFSEYTKLSVPSENNQVAFYAETDGDIYNKVMHKFAGTHSEASH